MSRKLLLLLIITVILVFVAQEVIQSKTGLKAPVKGRVIITSDYGYRVHPITQVKSFHNGIDISVPSGSGIYAPASGTVLSQYSNEAGGKQMVVKHNTGKITGYAHLSTYSVPVGAKVKKGQEIAKSGATGKVTGPHLHFTLKDSNGNYLNPQKYLS